MKKDQPLGLPRGSVRAILTLASLGAAIAAVFTGNSKAIEVFVPIATGLVGAYIGGRAYDGGVQDSQKKAEEKEPKVE